MKKMLALFLAGMMFFSLAACSFSATKEPPGMKVELQSYPKEGETTAMAAAVYYPEETNITTSGYPEDRLIKNVEAGYLLTFQSKQDKKLEDLRAKRREFNSNYEEIEFLGNKAFSAEGGEDFYYITVIFEEGADFDRYIDIEVQALDDEGEKTALELYETVPEIQEIINSLRYFGEVEATRD